MKNGPKVCSFWISGPHPRPPDRKRASDRHERNGQINQPSDGTLQGRHGQLADRRPATQPQRHKKPCPAREESNDEAETTCDHDRGGAQPDPRPAMTTKNGISTNTNARVARPIVAKTRKP
jgi:hypothetical protein